MVSLRDMVTKLFNSYSSYRKLINQMKIFFDGITELLYLQSSKEAY